MTNPSPAIAAVIAIVAIIGIVGALRLTPDAGTDKLVDNGSAAYEGTEQFRERFGDDAIVVLAKGDLQRLVLTEDLGQLQKLENCLSGAEPPPGTTYAVEVCERIAALDATRVVFGPATFLTTAATETSAQIQSQIQSVQAESQAAAEAAIARAAREGYSEEEQQQFGEAAAAAVEAEAFADYQDLATRVGDIRALLDPGSQQFVQSIVFDLRQASGTPKSRFGYLFPSEEGALISIRLEPDLDDETRQEAIGLIREAIASPEFEIKEASYELSGVPVVVEGLADELGSEILMLLGVAIVVMAMTLIAVFGPPLRLLPLFVALGAAAVAFGLLSIVGGKLTMASVAVLPVVIGLAVDYAIQLQARFREAAERGERPAAAAVIAAVRGGPVIGTAALATAVGFGALVLSPIPMVREFALALVIGIAAALAISLTAGLAALSMIDPEAAARTRAPRRGSARTSARLERARESFGTAGERMTGGAAALRERSQSFGNAALAAAISAPGRVLAIAAVLAVTGWAAGTRTEVVSDIRELVPGDLPALASLDELQSTTGVSGELDVIVRGEDVTTPEAITWMAEFKKRVLEQHGFAGEFPSCRAEGTELCPGPALPDLIQTTTGPPTAERIDAVLEIVPELFLQAILSRPEGEEEVASIAFLIPVMPLDTQEELIDSIRAELDPPPGIEAEVVGLPVLAADANASLAGSRYWLTLAGLLAVGLVLLAVYRSASRALVPLIPIALATGWSALVLAAMDVPLNPMSATLGVLVIAVATEFSVILSARYHEERAAGRTIGEALRETYARTGIAVLASGITSIAGFGVLIASGITMLRDFGLVTVVDLTVSLLGVMLVLPAALVWAESGFRPFPALLERLRGRSDAPAVSEPGAAR